jgi:hypothetical protein
LRTLIVAVVLAGLLSAVVVHEWRARQREAELQALLAAAMRDRLALRLKIDLMLFEAAQRQQGEQRSSAEGPPPADGGDAENSPAADGP